jgi:hypothetical protein
MPTNDTLNHLKHKTMLTNTAPITGKANTKDTGNHSQQSSQKKIQGFIIEIPKDNAYLGRSKNVFFTQDKSQATPYGSLNAAKVAKSHAMRNHPQHEFVITEL